MSRLSWFGKLNPLRVFSGYFKKHPKHKWLFLLVLVVILLALLNPVIGTIDKLLGLIGTLFGSLLGTSVGRWILLVLAIVVPGVLAYTFAKDRVLDVFRRYALAIHLRGIDAMLLGETDRASRDFRKVLRLGRYLDLAKGPAAEHGSIAFDARLKLARMLLDHGDVRAARSELARVPQDKLRKHMKRSFAELNAQVFARHPDHLPESVLEVIEASHKSWPGHPGIAELFADKLIENGQSERAAEVLTETMRRATKANSAVVAKRLAALNRRLAEEALHGERLKEALELVEQSLALERSEATLLLKADIFLARSDIDSALSVLGSLESPSAKERFARLLRHEGGPLEPRKLLQHVPRQESLLTLAEWYLERGELRRAERALEVCRRNGADSPRVLALLACVKLRASAPEEAGQALRRALTSFGSEA